MKRKLILIVVMLKASLGFSQNYQDLTFQAPSYVQPKNKAKFLAQQKQTRATIKEIFGKIPPIPAQIEVKIISSEQRQGYKLEKLEYHNGVDAIVPAFLLIPDGQKKPMPAVLYQHYHGGEYEHGKDEIFKKNFMNEIGAGEDLVRQGYVVMAIDAYAFGERSGKGPNGSAEKGKNEETTWAKWNTWRGRNFWGMMVRDDQMALQYLLSRPEVDPNRVATLGMSMGCFRSFWLAAVDTRVKVTIAVACITRNQDLIKRQGLGYHGIYYYVSDQLNHFDNEAVFACIAPRALLNLSGAIDKLEPLEGQQFINNTLTKLYDTLGEKKQFKGIIYDGIGHEYTPEMWKETLMWLKVKL